MTTRTYSWTVFSGLSLLALTATAAQAEGQKTSARTSGPGIERASLAVAISAQQTGQQSGQAADDASLATDLKAQLEERVPGADRVQVETSNGVVTLQGTVSSQAAKQSAVALASRTSGLRHVDDRLKVQPTP